MAFPIEITEVGEPEYPLIENLRDTIFGEVGHVSNSSIAEQFADRKDLLVLIAHLEGNPCGFAAGYRRSPGVFYLNYLGLLKDYRRQGLGRQLLSHQEHFARSRQYRQMQFNTFNHFPGMIRLGLSTGFTIAGVEQHAGSSCDLAIRFDKNLGIPTPAPPSEPVDLNSNELRVVANQSTQIVKCLDAGFKIRGMVHVPNQKQPLVLLQRT